MRCFRSRSTAPERVRRNRVRRVFPGSGSQVAVALGAAVALGVASPVAAQVELALRGGVAVARLATETNLPGLDGSRRGLVAGASLTLPVAQRFGIRAEGRFVQKGATGSTPTDFGQAEGTAQLDYVELSALFEATVSPDGPVSLHFLAGPAVAYQLKCTIVANIRNITSSAACDQGGNELNAASWDFGVAAGTGVEVGIFAGLRLGAEGLYTLGLSRLTDDPEDLRNRTLLLQAGLVVPFG